MIINLIKRIFNSEYKKNGLEIDSKGKLKISRIAENGKEACRQIDLIDKYYDEYNKIKYFKKNK